MPQRSIEQFQQRQPDFVMLSSASRKSVSEIKNPDWRTNRELLVAVPEATQFVKALQNDSLGYHLVAVFRQKPRLYTRALPVCARRSRSTRATGVQHLDRSTGA